jgi:hypothetical protein
MTFTPADYAEMLALYLGDGCISAFARTLQLRIALDLKYPRIITESRQLLQRCFPQNTVGVIRAHRGAMVYLSLYSMHLACLFPQHGRGKKHECAIRLEPWQREMVQASPWAFIRGCIRTDGASFINRTDIHRPEPYEYLSYEFSNMSQDILALFVDACDRVGVFTRVSCSRKRLWKVRINRRASVARMVEHVGLKA